jgi:hypothetical protein
LFSGFTSQEKELYNRIFDIIPMFSALIEACVDALPHVSESVLNSHTSDMHTVKEKGLILALATAQFTHLKLNLAISTDQKAKQGWNDPQCASLLIPPRFQDEFFNDPL